MIKNSLTRLISSISNILYKLQPIFIAGIILLFLLFSLRIYQINLVVRVSSEFRLYYAVGSFVLRKDGVFDGYRTKRGNFVTEYFMSLYEPQVSVDGVLHTVYRPVPTPIKFRSKEYFMYTTETRVYLVDNMNKIPNFQKNYVVGPPLNLYGQGNTIYNYKPQEVYDAYINNRINLNINCGDYAVAHCKNQFNHLNIQVDPKTGDTDSFDMKFKYYFEGDLASKEKRPVSAFITPEDFGICPTSVYDVDVCVDPFDRNYIRSDDMPVSFLHDNIEEKLTLKDLNFSSFYNINLKIPDKFNINIIPPKFLSIADTYFMVHKSNSVWIEIKPTVLGNTTSIQRQFGTMQFTGDICKQETCENAYTISLKSR